MKSFGIVISNYKYSDEIRALIRFQHGGVSSTVLKGLFNANCWRNILITYSNDIPPNISLLLDDRLTLYSMILE